MSEFAELLSGLAKMRHGEAQAAPTQNPDPEATVMRLKEAVRRFREADAGPRFAVGDLVTPVKDAPYTLAGAPHIVIATRRADYDFDSCVDIADSRYGMRLDIRTLSIDGGMLRAHWSESAFFVTWTLDKG